MLVSRMSDEEILTIVNAYESGVDKKGLDECLEVFKSQCPPENEDFYHGLAAGMFLLQNAAMSRNLPLEAILDVSVVTLLASAQSIIECRKGKL